MTERTGARVKKGDHAILISDSHPICPVWIRTEVYHKWRNATRQAHEMVSVIGLVRAHFF
eukprot:CAMPEP_0119300748 /NCGR_PEP_ID=MMETSP1333-20130426/2655_1 /TAXON_ID=418940 /ORGANISM="Scyphosphaera apsteinii, Strain RCC1455" /LENGTH=59 /DNA_ID=CAMNT_0007302637 /DNA_START=1226 /DNA_END=1408 /DNA_ORIENTATION=+